MSKFYEEDWEVPDNLKHRITKVYSNRKPDQEVLLNPEEVVEIFRTDLEKWLYGRAKQSSGSSKPIKRASSKEERNDKKEKIIQDLMEFSNMTRPQAEVAAAIELGETDGDCIELEEPK